MSAEKPDTPSLSALTTLLRRASGSPAADQLERGLDVVRERLAREHRGWRPLRRPWGLALALVALSALVFAGLKLRQTTVTPVDPPVGLQRVEGGEVTDGGYIEESGAGGVVLSFSEGSQFLLSPGTRGRLRNVSPEGAQVVIDRGVASFRITPSHSHRWSVEAGPFVVAVQGTEFSVKWDPALEQFEVALQRGRVRVSGPMLASEMQLRAGQKLSVRLTEGEAVITQDPAPPARVEPAPIPSATSSARVAVAPNEESRHGSAGVAGPAVSASPEARGRGRWSEALAKGAWDQILADVEHDGLEATLQSASKADLSALADAARYRKRTAWARAALLAQRQRFPSSSLDTAFLLGRVEELAGGDRHRAVTWYGEYLSRAPSGTYAAEALGRKMILSKELDGPAVARGIAEEYLRRFPSGTYAGAARALRAE
jgi:FecR-like protein